MQQPSGHTCNQNSRMLCCTEYFEAPMMVAAASVFQREIWVITSLQSAETLQFVPESGSDMRSPLILTNRANIHFMPCTRDPQRYTSPVEADAPPQQIFPVQHSNPDFPISPKQLFHSRQSAHAYLDSYAGSAFKWRIASSTDNRLLLVCSSAPYSKTGDLIHQDFSRSASSSLSHYISVCTGSSASSSLE